MTAAAYDFYSIGGPTGFYVGQAKRTRRGGWERRVAEHRVGRSRIRPAHQLLTSGAEARCVGTIVALDDYACATEARLFDSLRRAGWKPMHRRPRMSSGYRAAWEQMTDSERAAFIADRAERRNRSNGMSPRDAASRGGKARAAKCSPEKLKEIAQLAVVSRSSKARSSCMKRAQPWKFKTVEAQKKAGLLGHHLRWHVNRGITSPNCAMCASSGVNNG